MTALASQLQAALDSCVAAGSPGALVVVDAPRLGIEFAGASGLFERGSVRRLGAGDPFRAASVSKAVTAATVVKLAAAGRWRLDDSVAPFLPQAIADRLGGLRGLSTPKALTFRRLLSHTSGVPDYFFDERFQARVRAEPNRAWRPEDLAAAALEDGELGDAYRSLVRNEAAGVEIVGATGVWGRSRTIGRPGMQRSPAR